MLLESDGESSHDPDLLSKEKDLTLQAGTLDLRGHEEAQRRILGLIRRNRLPHALLITGPQGIGKKIFVRQLGALLLCPDLKSPLGPDALFDSYISSDVAKHFYARTHPNVWDEQGEGSLQLSKNHIDNIRSLLGFFKKTSGVTGARVGILPDLHLFNRQALNALLKGLEEPPHRSFLILTSHKPGALPKTVLSRIDKIHLGYPAAADYESILKTRAPQIDQETLVFLRDFSPSPGMALLCFELGGLGLYKNLKEWLGDSWGDNAKKVRSLPLDIINDWVSRVKNKEVSFERILSIFALFLDKLLVKESPYFIKLSGEDVQKAHSRVEEAHKIIQETLVYDLDQRQCLLILFSLFINGVQ